VLPAAHGESAILVLQMKYMMYPARAHGAPVHGKCTGRLHFNPCVDTPDAPMTLIRKGVCCMICTTQLDAQLSIDGM